MRSLKIFTISLLIQTIVLTPAQAFDFSDAFCQENMSPSIYIQSDSFQTAFIEKLENDYFLDVLQLKEIPVSKSIRMEALGITTALSAKKKKEYFEILNVVDKHGFKLELSAVELGMGVKKIQRVIGADIIKIGKKQAREKEVWLQKKMLVCALRSCRWNVSNANKQTGILKKRIYELIPSEIIKANRILAEQELKKIIIRVLEGNEWNVRKALRDKKLIDQKVGRHILYSMLTAEWIDAQRKVYIEGIEEQQREEIVSAINMFRQERKSLTAVQEYLGLKKGTFYDRMRKFKTTKFNVLYDPKEVLPVLVDTKADITQACKILGTDSSILSSIFKNEVEQIREFGTYIDQVEKMTEVEKIVYDLEHIDSYLNGLADKISGVDALSSTEVMSLFDLANFIIYRCLKKIENMPINSETEKYMNELIVKVTFYSNALIKMDKVIECKVNDTKLIVTLLEIIAMEINGVQNNRQMTFSSEEIVLLYKNRLAEAGKAETMINNSI